MCERYLEQQSPLYVSLIELKKSPETPTLIHPLNEMLLGHLEVSPSDNTLLSDIKTAISSGLKPSILAFLLQTSAFDPRFKSLPYVDDASRCYAVTVKAEPDDRDCETATSKPHVPALHTLEEGAPPPLPTAKL
ncbi:hypothetical protein MAR_014848 [Mya arenaria]|uniref:Uncharacterized protein n=1 Tax=Mya arenaria TaxID=6604 RepID=A0ABY7FI86_MYAAR|nr:hypothetical protein MAR_014848 [Mya arenaria]